jgi:hypothetical protein
VELIREYDKVSSGRVVRRLSPGFIGARIRRMRFLSLQRSGDMWGRGPGHNEKGLVNSTLTMASVAATSIVALIPRACCGRPPPGCPRAPIRMALTEASADGTTRRPRSQGTPKHKQAITAIREQRKEAAGALKRLRADLKKEPQPEQCNELLSPAGGGANTTETGAAFS